MKNASLCCTFCILLCLLLLFVWHKPTPKPPISFQNSATVRVYNPKTENTTEMPIEEYVWRCVAREMPVTFHAEALKAQAVAARSYLLHKLLYAPAAHENADVCTDFSHCAAFLTDIAAMPEAQQAVYKAATKATEGELLLYEGAVANTVFHAMSCGKTENAENVWQKAVPYLVSVDSAADCTAKNFETVVSFPWDVIFAKLSVSEKTVASPTYHAGGTVKSIQIGGKDFSGTTVRKLLNLRSAAFSAVANESGITFTVHGYGHGVGMSQEGANLYAAQGLSYTEILAKYYPKTVLSQGY